MITIDTAINEVVAQGVATYPELMQRTRQVVIVKKRWKAWALLTEKGFNQSEIARRFNMNPATVHHGLKEQKLIQEFEERRAKIIKL